MKKDKKLLFIDTSAFISLYDMDDVNHDKSVKFFTPENLGNINFIPFTTNFVFDEVYAYFCRRHDDAIKIGTFIRESKILKFIRIDENDEEEAWMLAKKYNDKTFSFTDCTSFVAMKKYRAQCAFTYDKHFTQMGFKSYPE